MSQLTYKEINTGTLQSKYSKFGDNGLIYFFPNYFIIFNEENLTQCYVILSHCFKKFLSLSGKCELEIIYGSIKINGIQFTIPFKEKLYSPLSHAKITLETEKTSERGLADLDDVINILIQNNDINEHDIDSLKSIFIRNDSHKIKISNILKLSNFFCLTTEDIVQFKDFKKLFDVDIDFPFAKKLNFSLTLEEEANYKITEEMNETLETLTKTQLDQHLSIAIVGPKNCGKSSFLKTVINKLFNQGHDKIYIIDGDPGQSEFSTCGSLNLTVVSKPLFGQPFTHFCSGGVKIIEQYYLGLLSPNDDPKLYCRSFERLYQTYISHYKQDGKPLVINTMGWPQGIGLLLLAFKLLIVNPSHIVQLKKGKPNQDLADITPELLENLSLNESTLLSNLRHRITSIIKIIKSPVVTGKPSQLQLNPHAHRDLTMLSYLYLMTENRPLCFPDSLPPDYASNPVTRLRCRIPEIIYFSGEHSNKQKVPSVRLKVVYSEGSMFEQIDFIAECFALQWVALCKPASAYWYKSVVDKSPYVNSKQHETELMLCLGMGLVSHIRKDLYEIDLLTGVDVALLDGCCLVKGRIFPPECLFLNQPEIISKHNNRNLPFISPIITVGTGRMAIPTRKSLPKVRRHVHN